MLETWRKDPEDPSHNVYGNSYLDRVIYALMIETIVGTTCMWFVLNTPLYVVFQELSHNRVHFVADASNVRNCDWGWFDV